MESTKGKILYCWNLDKLKAQNYNEQLTHLNDTLQEKKKLKKYLKE